MAKKKGKTRKTATDKLLVARKELNLANPKPDLDGLRKAARAFADGISQMGTAEKTFLTGNAATTAGQGGRAQTSWTNQGQSALATSLIQQVSNNLQSQFQAAPEDVELALAEAGLSWGPPFAPGRPLDPFWAYRGAPRTWDYTVGENIQVTPRWNRVSFPTIKAIYDAYDVAQICVRHLINDVRSLDYDWVPARGVKVDISGDIDIAEAFFESPDGRQPFGSWLAEWLQDILRYDAGTLYTRRNNGNDPIAFEVVDGTTMIPLVDFYGRPPVDAEDDDSFEVELSDGNAITPAFVQIIEGLPWDWLTLDDVTYQPWNPLPESQYGLAPLEAVLMSANTDIRFQWHFLQFFTEGTLPAGFMEAPPDMSDPAQLADWENNWNAVMLGDQAKLRQIRWVPNGAKFTAAKANADQFNSEFPLYLMRRTCASFGVTPNDLGFTENVNRATGDTQIDVQFRVGTLPLLKHLQDIINLLLSRVLGLRCRIQFDDGKEVEDRVATAQAHQIYVSMGAESLDEVRTELGYAVNKDRPIPRFILNQRTGPIPLLALMSMAGEVDPETYAPADGQELINTPYIAPPGPIAQMGTPEAKSAAQTSAQAMDDMIQATTGDAPPVAAPAPAPAPAPAVDAQGNPVAPALPAETNDINPEDEQAQQPAPPAASTPVTKENWREILESIDRYEKAIATGVDNTGGPGVNPHNAFLLQESSDEADEIEDEVTKAALVALDLRRWRANTRNRLRKGQAPRRFHSTTMPDEIVESVWKELEHVRSVEQANQVFTAVDKAMGSWLSAIS